MLTNYTDRLTNVFKCCKEEGLLEGMTDNQIMLFLQTAVDFNLFTPDDLAGAKVLAEDVKKNSIVNTICIDKNTATTSASQSNYHIYLSYIFKHTLPHKFKL